MSTARPPMTAVSLLRAYVGSQPAAVAVMAGLLVFSIGLEIAEPRIAAHFIESVQLGRAESVLVGIAGVFLAVAVTRQAARIVSAYASERVSWTATNAAREDLTAHVLSLDLTFHESRPPGELIERIDGDVNQVAEFFSSLIVHIAGNVLLVLGILIALATLDWRVGLTFTAVTILSYLALSRIAGIAGLKWEDDREQSARFFGYVGEATLATEDLRSSGATGYAMARFHRHLRAWLPVKVRAEGWGSAIWVVLSIAFTAGTAIAFGYGGVFYRDGVVSLAGVYLIVAYAAMLNTPMEVLRHQVQTLQQAMAATRRIAELFAHRSSLADGTAAIPSGPLSVRFDHVSFGYGRDDSGDESGDGSKDGSGDGMVMREVSFDVPAGTTLGLVGRTGAGKTTIASLLFRLYDASRGRVLVGGVDVREASLASLRSRIGFVPQDVQIFDATLRENLTFFDERADDRRLLEILDVLELRPWLEGLPDGLSSRISPGTLSAGQAQLIALARVFLTDPGLVVLDEPSSRLDPVTEAQVERTLDRMLAGRTAIVIAHRLDTIRRTDQVIVLDTGAIAERGATAGLLADPGSRLARLYQVGKVLT
ncbi:ABC transporter ATP-binding protein [Microbispora triticiradicis]|uniref:ABC transporter ATP-binding protein n=2 Tax=Microbispora TaxID=2005 RepID=A0ABY3LP86_9ACTN|nr:MULTISPECIES: ABC transporter ATP-binding protein [Microbispora]TLP55765.1 ABC transporter ATP-binding protein [Microbispora fusca]TYB44371.1 ABC transporter ATP-binding protein [Microbispora tritici]